MKHYFAGMLGILGIQVVVRLLVQLAAPDRVVNLGDWAFLWTFVLAWVLTPICIHFWNSRGTWNAMLASIALAAVLTVSEFFRRPALLTVVEALVIMAAVWILAYPVFYAILVSWYTIKEARTTKQAAS